MMKDRVGMHNDDVIMHNNKLDSYIREESKIDLDLKELADRASSAYKSGNSSRLNEHNKQLSDSEYIKVRNLKSYKKYIDNKIQDYVNRGKQALNIVEDGDLRMKK